jgi:hypothetical protein
LSISTGDIFIVYDDIKGKMRDKSGYLLVFVAVLFLFFVTTSGTVMQAANAAIITKLLNK